MKNWYRKKMIKFEEKLKDCKITVKKNVSLAEYTTTKVGGAAEYFVEVGSEDELVGAVKAADEFGINHMVMGGGSNLLISDEGYKGLVVLNRYSGISQNKEVFSVKSGTVLFNLVLSSTNDSYSGLENLIGIPGTVGGGICGNAGAYGSSVSDCLIRVKVLRKGEILWVDKKDGNFSYRNSLFKKNGDIILGAEFKFTKAEGVKEKVKNILLERSKKFAKNMWCPGSFFKNVIADDLTKETLTKIPQDKVVFGKIPAGFLLESVGAKGMKVGKIEVSENHANFFVNKGGGTAKDYYALAMKLRNLVKEKYNLNLEPEVQIIGFKKKAAILGFGLEGKDLYEYLLNGNYEITILDQKDKKDLDLEGIKVEDVKFVCGTDYLKTDLSKFDIIFRSPGVYRYLPEIVEAERKGTEISSAIKLFFEKCPAKTIGVTGTKGKGTTSTLIYEILKKAGKKVYLAGNIGKPYLSLLPDLDTDVIVVLEISSFQLIDMKQSPNLAVVLNITEDHMDWHKDRQEYLEAKENIVKHQKSDDYAVINHDYETPKSFADLTKSQVYFFSKKDVVKGSYVKDGLIYLNTNKEELIGDTKDLQLRGEHNWENITAAICAASLFGASTNDIKNVVFSFKGLEHRLELVTEINGRKFYNDSFATGPQPTMAAIDSFNEKITLILGGYDKGLNYDFFIKKIVAKNNLANILLIGDLAAKIGDLLKEKNYQGKVENLGKSKMADIVKKAFEITKESGIILLSPAAASFDMFKNYKERGYQFKNEVMALKNNE
jgi:UDP-N-acetylmuramoylalanine--D-glutamate ligase